MVDGRCMRCKKNGQEMKNAAISQTARGGYIAKGQCVKCDCNMAALLSKDNAEKAVKEGVKKAF